MASFTKLSAVSAREWRLLAESLLLLPASGLALRLVSLSRWQAILSGFAPRQASAAEANREAQNDLAGTVRAWCGPRPCGDPTGRRASHGPSPCGGCSAESVWRATSSSVYAGTATGWKLIVGRVSRSGPGRLARRRSAVRTPGAPEHSRGDRGSVSGIIDVLNISGLPVTTHGAREFAWLQRLATHVQVRRAHTHRDIADLPRLRDVILEDFRTRQRAGLGVSGAQPGS